ncbi:hypothetical protein [Amaricoccus solimangrovi]|uniref:hypothetical protein n=1 Tax=Amaricoccus solimangrovi TaxID=2589815 RepID=UPI001F3337BF|nr:hypothetical protein [Amaricoccus solimangrovi]
MSGSRARSGTASSVSATEVSNSRERRKAFEMIVEYRGDATREVARRRARGLPEDDIPPHPDTIHICPLSGRVVATGPWTPEERQRQRDLLRAKEGVRDTIRDAERKLRRRPGDAIKLERIATCEKVIARIEDELSNLTRVILEGV